MCVKGGIYQGAAPNPERLSDTVGPAVVKKNDDHHAKGRAFWPSPVLGRVPYARLSGRSSPISDDKGGIR
jgi:hypothetical protein